jgi:hypothetical protein
MYLFFWQSLRNDELISRCFPEVLYPRVVSYGHYSLSKGKKNTIANIGLNKSLRVEWVLEVYPNGRDHW